MKLSRNNATMEMYWCFWLFILKKTFYNWHWVTSHNLHFLCSRIVTPELSVSTTIHISSYLPNVILNSGKNWHMITGFFPHLSLVFSHSICFVLNFICSCCRFFSIDVQLACCCGSRRCRGVVNDTEAEERMSKLYAPRNKLIDWEGE